MTREEEFKKALCSLLKEYDVTIETDANGDSSGIKFTSDRKVDASGKVTKAINFWMWSSVTSSDLE